MLLLPAVPPGDFLFHHKAQLGKRAVVLQAIDPIANTGMVRVGTEEWRAASVDHSPIAKDSIVEVVGVEGVRLQVQRITGDTTNSASQPMN